MAGVVSKIGDDIFILYLDEQEIQYRCANLFSDLISHITNAFSSILCVLKLTDRPEKMCGLRVLTQK